MHLGRNRTLETRILVIVDFAERIRKTSSIQMDQPPPRTTQKEAAAAGQRDSPAPALFRRTDAYPSAAT
jgi:hypothetical protein